MSTKALVTGGCGFIGSHLCEFLIDRDVDVVALDRYNSNNDWGWLEESAYKNDLNVILGDIRDFDSVLKAMQGCEIVFHLAALIGIPYSYQSPLAYIRTNVEGTYNVLEAGKLLEVDQILVSSTSETYGTAQYVPIDEKHPLVGQSPYSASKIAADQLAISYFRSFDLPIKIVRPFNTFGPRQSARAVIPTVVTQMLVNGSDDVKLGNVMPTRDLTYVTDTCAGFYHIFESSALYGKVTNVGMNQEISIEDLVKKLKGIVGFNGNIVSDASRIRPESSEVDRLVCDNSMLQTHTNWSPKESLDSGLLRTVQWFVENLEKSKVKASLYNV